MSPREQDTGSPQHPNYLAQSIESNTKPVPRLFVLKVGSLWASSMKRVNARKATSFVAPFLSELSLPEIKLTRYGSEAAAPKPVVHGRAALMRQPSFAMSATKPIAR
jgi:hypothetical protein